MKKIILPLVATVLLSMITTFLSYKWLEGFSIDPSIENSFDSGMVVNRFISWLVYISALIMLPFLLKDLLLKFKTKENEWWKTLLFFELFSLVFSYLITPPDLFSTIFLFIICQPIVIVNGFVAKRKLSEIHKGG